MKAERRVMTVCSLRHFLPVLRPEIPQHQVWSFRSREFGEPINSTVLANPVSCLHMVGMHLLGKPRAYRLFCREKSLLRSRHFVKPPSDLYIRIRFMHNTNPQLIRGIVRRNGVTRKPSSLSPYISSI